MDRAYEQGYAAGYGPITSTGSSIVGSGQMQPQVAVEETLKDSARRILIRLNETKYRLSGVTEALTGPQPVPGDNAPKQTREPEALQELVNESNWLLNQIEVQLQFLEYKVGIRK